MGSAQLAFWQALGLAAFGFDEVGGVHGEFLHHLVGSHPAEHCREGYEEDFAEVVEGAAAGAGSFRVLKASNLSGNPCESSALFGIVGIQES